jgi:hypothetical protein
MSRFVFTAALVFVAPAFAQAAYFAHIDDLPLPPGFTEVASVPPFESEQGGIVVSAAEGVLSASQIREFYLSSLSQLGWGFSPGADDELVFQRGRETLRFSVREGVARTWLSVRLVTDPVPIEAD